jgi:hypothetical protein
MMMVLAPTTPFVVEFKLALAVLPFFFSRPWLLCGACLYGCGSTLYPHTTHAHTQNHPQLRLLENSHTFDIISPITGPLFALSPNPDWPARMLGDFRTDSTGTQGTGLLRLLVLEVNTSLIGAIERFNILIRTAGQSSTLQYDGFAPTGFRSVLGSKGISQGMLVRLSAFYGEPLALSWSGNLRKKLRQQIHTRQYPV